MSKAKKVVIRPKVQRVGDHRGNKIEIDKRLPVKDRKGVVIHERKEDKLQKAGDKYESAHKQANRAEKKAVGAKQFKKETADAMKIYRKNLAQKRKRGR